MLKICYVAESKYGLGLFAGEDIESGEQWWEETEENSISLDQKQWETLSRSEINKSENSKNLLSSISHFSSPSEKKNRIDVALDDSRFVNHSENPNSGWNERGSFALRDIKKGDEITENYLEYGNVDWASSCVAFLTQENNE